MVKYTLVYGARSPLALADEWFTNMKNTFPYPYYGECSFCSMKQRIRKHKLELLNNK